MSKAVFYHAGCPIALKPKKKWRKQSIKTNTGWRLSTSEKTKAVLLRLSRRALNPYLHWFWMISPSILISVRICRH